MGLRGNKLGPELTTVDAGVPYSVLATSVHLYLPVVKLSFKGETPAQPPACVLGLDRASGPRSAGAELSLD